MVGFIVRPPAAATDASLPVVIVVVATQYRGVDGGDGAEEFGGADTADVHALVPMAKQVPGTDVSRLFLLGGLRGAMQGLIAVREGLPVRAAAFRSGMFDLARAIAERPELEQDWRVSLGSAEEMAGALATAGIPHQVVVYEREEHQLAFHRREWVAAAAAWFRTYEAPRPGAAR